MVTFTSHKSDDVMCTHLNIISTLRKKWERHICACKCLMQALSLYRDSAWHVHMCLSSEFPYRVCAMSLVPSPSRLCNILIESCLILSVSVLVIRGAMIADYIYWLSGGNNRHISKLIKLYWQVRTDGLLGAHCGPAPNQKLNEWLLLKRVPTEVDQCVSITKMSVCKTSATLTRRNTI